MAHSQAWAALAWVIEMTATSADKGCQATTRTFFLDLPTNTMNNEMSDFQLHGVSGHIMAHLYVHDRIDWDSSRNYKWENGMTGFETALKRYHARIFSSSRDHFQHTSISHQHCSTKLKT